MHIVGISSIVPVCSFRRILIQDYAQIIPFLAGDHVEISISIEIKNLDQVEFDSFLRVCPKSIRCVTSIAT